MLKGMKDTYVDVKATLSTGSHVIIEMQVLNVEGFEKRVLYNAAKAYSSQLKKAEAHDSLEPVIALTITDFTMFDDKEMDDKVISFFKLREKEQFIKYNDDVELIFIELPKFNKTEEELETITDKWIYFIKNAGSLEYIPSSMQNDQALKEAFEIANTAGLSEEELEWQNKRHDFIYLQKSSRRKARAEARAEGRAEVALSLRNQGIPIETITKATGLSEDEINNL